MKRIFPLVLALVLSLGLCVPVLAADFSDVPADHWAYSAIQAAAEKGITSGYSDGTFQPSAPVTNIQFMVMLSRAFYGEDVATWTASPAASKNKWWWPNWYALFNRGLLTGNKIFISRSILSEQGSITRQNMAWLLAAVLKDKGGSATEEQKAEAQVQIADYASIPAEYQDAVKTAFALGLITGFSDGTFGGGKTMNRAQGCIVIDRLAQYVGDGSGTVSAVPVSDDLVNVPDTPNSIPADQSPSTSTENEAPTLRDGSAVTEANALKIIEQIKQVYPNGTTWDSNTARNAYIEIGGHALGGLSGATAKVGNSYRVTGGGAVSMTCGCGGFASLVSDAIFGGDSTGGDNFSSRKLNSVADIRPGDIIIQLNADGNAMHMFAAASSVKSSKVMNGVTAYCIARYDGNMNGKTVSYSESSYIFDTAYNSSGMYFEAWTRYPA